jgi:DNA modification methylase
LKPHPGNSRTHSEQQVAQVAASIQQFGWTNPILIGPDNVITAGHARWLAARQLRLEEVPVIVISGLTPVQRKALVIADNRLALNAGWDEEKLRLELDELRAADFDLDLLGFEVQELERLWADLDGPSGAPGDADSVPERPVRPVTAPGEMWRLGSHRLFCGDAANRSHMDRLLSGERADLLYTALPHAPDPAGTHGFEDEQLGGADRARLTAVFASCRTALKATASLYITYRPLDQPELHQALEVNGFEIHGQIICANSKVAGGSRYRTQHEPILYAHLKGHRDRWYGGKTESSLWHEPEDPTDGGNPLSGLVHRSKRAITNSSRKRNLVLDPFASSGSTVIACQRTGRRARLIEINPSTCDAIVERWQKFTGKKAVLDGSNCEFRDLACERLGTDA